MDARVEIEVVDRLTGVARIETCTLPVEIGKQPKATSNISLDSKYTTISRIHGTIEFSDGQYFFTDESSNGTTIGGETITGERREIVPGVAFQIENYNIRIVSSSPVLLKHTDQALKQFGEYGIDDVASYRIFRDGDHVRLEREVTGTQNETSGDGGDAALGRLRIRDAGVVLELNAAAEGDPEIRVNNAPVSGASIEVRVFDVIGIGADRIEVLQKGHNKIVCGNSECHLLNDLPYEENCVWCGYYLASSGSFTRVTPP